MKEIQPPGDLVEKIAKGKEFYKEIIKLINEPLNIVFFTGAGISYNPPSSLPLANEVKLELIETICKKGEKTSINQFYQLHQDQIKECLKNISMESIFEIIGVQSELDVINMITKIFRAKEPNNSHIFLARLIKESCSVITTNFDMLIEKALEEKLKTESCYSINKLFRKIIHIHGSINDRQSIITILSQIGQEIITEKIENELKNALKNKIVIFIGWSDGDIDITPALFLSDVKRIIWIDHNKSNSKVVRYNNDEIKKSKHPIDKLIERFEGTKYIGNTDHVIDEIWQELWDDKPLKPLGKANCKWKEQIKKIEDLKECDRVLIFLEVLERIDLEKKLPLELIKRLEDTYSEFSETEKHIFYELSCKKSVCERIIFKYEEAIKSAEQGLKKILTSERDLSWFIELRNDIASAYNDWGHSDREKGDCKKAIEKHIKAIEIFEKNVKKLNDELSKILNLTTEDKMRILILLDKAQVHTNLGSTFLELWEAGSQCSKSPNFLNNLFNKAEKNYLEGIRIHEELEEKLSEALRNYNDIKLGDLYNNIANVYSRKSEKEKAKNYYIKCLDIKKKCGDVRGMKRLLEDYLPFIEKNDLKPENLETMRVKSEALKSAFVEYPISSTHLLYYKKKLVSLQ